MAKKKTIKKKSVKKAAKKTATKKVAAKKSAPKKVAKKVTKKAVKKSAPKKAAPKKAAKKATPKKSAAPKRATPVQLTLPLAVSRIGEKIADFEMPATSGKTVRSQDLRGKYVVLYFYPKDSTPGCTIEGHEFTKLLPEFHNSGAEVFGVSRDSVQSHENFKSKECFTFELLSDADEKLCKEFDVIKEKNMYGNKVMGIERSTFLMGPEGELVAEWRGVKVPGHAQEVLNKVKALQA